jgi:hypothetical protein
MSLLRFIFVLYLLLPPLQARALDSAEGFSFSSSPRSTPALVVAQAPERDQATIGQLIELDNPNFRANLGEWACSFLVREKVANWNVSGGGCKFVKFLNTPKHVKFTATGIPGEFAFHPISLGKDVVRFLVENTANGRQAIISLHVTIAEPEA